jgi:UDP-glucose:(heptosyl)LPS alpha-1,3-glucosyltransferase
LYSLERVWECDAYRAGDGVHRAWLERRRAYEPAWKGWLRARQAKHREMMELERAVFEGARLIIANSRMVAGEIEKNFATPRERIRVIYNGAPVRLVPPGTREAVREGLGVGAQCVALFAGLGWERKGLRFAIEAADRVPDCVLVVAGTGKRRGLPRAGTTRFLGPVKETGEMGELMAAADVFVLPTIYDPFSNASLEAMAAGLPVITTAANGFTEIMRPGLDGEVLGDPADVTGIAAGIVKWRQRETSESREARQLEAARYTPERNMRETLAALGLA